MGRDSLLVMPFWLWRAAKEEGGDVKDTWAFLLFRYSATSEYTKLHGTSEKEQKCVIKRIRSLTSDYTVYHFLGKAPKPKEE